MKNVLHAYQALANAIVQCAVEDYRMTDNPHDLETLERFFRSPWFGILTAIDPEYLISKLRSEKLSNGSAEVLEKRIATTSLRTGLAMTVIDSCQQLCAPVSQ